MIAVSEERKKFPELSQKKMYFLFTVFALSFGVLAFLFNSPQEIWTGFWIIMSSPATLLTDYIELANAGAAFLNVSIMTLESLLLVRMCKAKINGPVIAGILIITGFSFFGKNFYNSLPIILGAFGFAKVTQIPLEKSLLAALFGTALSPLVSELSFGQELPLSIGIFLGSLSGFIAGFLLPPLARHVITFTKGFSLYNIGFVCGLIGTVFTSIMRNFGREVESVSILASGYNFPFSLFLLVLFTCMILIGLIVNKGDLKGLKEILSRSGQLSTDYIEIGGVGATFFNMGLLGIISTIYILLLGGELNGPVLGGIFCIVGFGAFGKNIKTIVAPMLGATVMSYFTLYEIQDTNVLISILFVTSLSPIAGHYGAIAGFIAGALHLTLVVNIGFLHGGINLYNNGFAAGLVAAILVPFLEALHYRKVGHELLDQEINPADEVKLN
ncbi:Protein of unknown function [Carnobacterium iners]|uniref:DUF1576 domain-containing protein n=1 Tax=Carnobacterium iners TaxID=1073423 RepID=A0A1X7MXB9_9LACT|nr:DUF1576 domain-containing protein [Carnobacterium iners]SEK17715.1 Protein of unknown function [Carnobacterium iners]SMH29071.1 Protein of unknown function [Carnobacterium iners]